MKLKTLLLSASLMMACTAQAQTCTSGIGETAPETNFTDNEDGTVTDNTTGLMWRQPTAMSMQVTMTGVCQILSSC